MVRAATLLAEIGDARGRFPTDDALAALAGCAPSTRRSGKLHVGHIPLRLRQEATRRDDQLRR